MREISLPDLSGVAGGVAGVHIALLGGAAGVAGYSLSAAVQNTFNPFKACHAFTGFLLAIPVDAVAGGLIDHPAARAGMAVSSGLAMGLMSATPD